MNGVFDRFLRALAVVAMLGLGGAVFHMSASVAGLKQEFKGLSEQIDLRFAFTDDRISRIERAGR